MKNVTTPPEVRFWRYVCKTPSCWNWAGGATSFGHGVFFLRKTPKRKLTTAHRFSWELHRGPVPDGLFVLHHCDNPGCVNPEHLYVGTQRQNIVDFHKRWRWPHKLTAEQVQEIRRRGAGGMSAMKMAKEFPVSQPLISAILRGKLYAHVT